MRASNEAKTLPVSKMTAWQFIKRLHLGRKQFVWSRDTLDRMEARVVSDGYGEKLNVFGAVHFLKTGEIRHLYYFDVCRSNDWAEEMQLTASYELPHWFASRIVDSKVLVALVVDPVDGIRRTVLPITMSLFVYAIAGTVWYFQDFILSACGYSDGGSGRLHTYCKLATGLGQLAEFVVILPLGIAVSVAAALVVGSVLSGSGWLCRQLWRFSRPRLWHQNGDR